MSQLSLKQTYGYNLEDASLVELEIVSLFQPLVSDPAVYLEENHHLWAEHQSEIRTYNDV